jgi:hypothetical protein
MGPAFPTVFRRALIPFLSGVSRSGRNQRVYWNLLQPPHHCIHILKPAGWLPSLFLLLQFITLGT